MRATRCCARSQRWKICAEQTQREIANAKTYGISSFAREVLDIADNLQRALDAVPAEAKEAADAGLKALIEGVELTERSLHNTLEKNGVRKGRSAGAEIRSQPSPGDVRNSDASVPQEPSSRSCRPVT